MGEYYKIYYCNFYVRCIHLKMQKLSHFQKHASDAKMAKINFVVLVH